MAEKKSFKERSRDDRDEVIAFWSSPRGIVAAVVMLVAVIGFAIFGGASDIIGMFL